MEFAVDSRKDKAGIRNLEAGLGIFKKKRGNRVRRGFTMLKEGRVGSSDTVSSAAYIDREGSSQGLKQDVLPLHEGSGACARGEDTNVDLTGIMNSIMEHKGVSIFRCWLESQKRARYKKMIRQDVDFQTISSRISGGSVSSAKELYRDVLLLSNNAVVFYPKNSPEHKSALNLRDLVSKALQQSAKNPAQCLGDHGVTHPVLMGKSKRFQSMHLCNLNTKGNSVVSGGGAGTPKMENGKKDSHADVPEGTVARKRSIGGAVMGGRRSGRRGHESNNKGWKRAQRR